MIYVNPSLLCYCFQDFCASRKLFHFYWRYTVETCPVPCWTGKSFSFNSYQPPICLTIFLYYNLSEGVWYNKLLSVMSFLWRSLVFFRRMMLKIMAVLKFCSLDSSWIPVRYLLIGTFQFAIVIFHSWLYDVFRWKVMTKQLMMMSSHCWLHHAWGLSSSWQELHLEKGLLLDWHYLFNEKENFIKFYGTMS